MTETTEIESSATADPNPTQQPHRRRPNRLYQAAAWVAIVAGTVFVVGAVFFTGFVLGRDGDASHHRGGGMGQHHMGPQRMLLRPDGRPDGPRPDGPLELRPQDGPAQPPAPPAPPPRP